MLLEDLMLVVAFQAYISMHETQPFPVDLYNYAAKKMFELEICWLHTEVAGSCDGRRLRAIQLLSGLQL